MKTKNDENNYKSGFFLLVFSVSKNGSSEMNPCYMLNISALWGFYPISRIFSFFFSLGKLIHAKNHLLPIGGQHSHITSLFPGPEAHVSLPKASHTPLL